MAMMAAALPSGKAFPRLLQQLPPRFPTVARKLLSVPRSAGQATSAYRGGLFGRPNAFCCSRRSLYTEVTSSTQLKDALKQPEKLFVTQFSAAWCGPCRKTKPVVMKWGDEYDGESVDFLAVDIDDLADAVDQYKITSVPTFILIRNGEQLAKIIGSDLEKVKNAIEKHKSK